jgi:hypothetical protein
LTAAQLSISRRQDQKDNRGDHEQTGAHIDG